VCGFFDEHKVNNFVNITNPHSSTTTQRNTTKDIKETLKYCNIIQKEIVQICEHEPRTPKPTGNNKISETK
jgi:hypothetical protein